MNDDQNKLNERVRKHLETIELTQGMLKALLAMALLIGGYVMFVLTKGNFGDVPMLLGGFYMKKVLTEG